MSGKQYPGEENRIVDNVILPRNTIENFYTTSLLSFSIINPRVHGVTARNATACLMFPGADHVEAVGEHRMKLPLWGQRKKHALFPARKPLSKGSNYRSVDNAVGQAISTHLFEDLHFNTVENCNFPFYHAPFLTDRACDNTCPLTTRSLKTFFLSLRPRRLLPLCLEIVGTGACNTEGSGEDGMECCVLGKLSYRGCCVKYQVAVRGMN